MYNIMNFFDNGLWELWGISIIIYTSVILVLLKHFDMAFILYYKVSAGT